MAALKARALSLLFLTIALTIGALASPRALRHYPALTRLVSPGDLSLGHAFLGGDCESCHTALKGIDATKCISCHANNRALLGKEPTVFHATIKDCRGCHVEHQGRSATVTSMAHAPLAISAIKLRSDSAGRTVQLSEQALIRWLRRDAPKDSDESQTLSAALDCSTCHGTKDPHRTLFGNSCADCHTLRKWQIAGYRHPPPESRDCAQCHQAPPSHYMEHFHMISEKIAGIEHADPRECERCHKTTAWNDIKGVGWYKHH